MRDSSNLFTMLSRLSQVVAESREDNTILLESVTIVLQHIIKDFETVEHQSVITVVMPVALGTAQVIAGPDKINETLRTRAPDAFKKM